ncbi:hypothetical protein YC2023_077950 [Brassica napus]
METCHVPKQEELKKERDTFDWILDCSWEEEDGEDTHIKCSVCSVNLSGLRVETDPARSRNVWAAKSNRLFPWVRYRSKTDTSVRATLWASGTVYNAHAYQLLLHVRLRTV